MKLGDWLKANKKTQAEFAIAVGSAQGHVSRWVNGQMIPELASALKIEKVTKGQVSTHDWEKPKKRKTR